jgi:hypothetical protein
MTGLDGEGYFALDRDLARRGGGNCLLDVRQMVAFNKATYLTRQMCGAKGKPRGYAIVISVVIRE